jgi:hypothetical protein
LPGARATKSCSAVAAAGGASVVEFTVVSAKVGLPRSQRSYSGTDTAEISRLAYRQLTCALTGDLSLVIYPW